ncbi:DUF6234 family protein [Actinomadura montaniterrae]|uniref:DUF6234 family protein n=1 Tax=Actinomadura montaniterrae TaxID=1803903 RepID=UPI00178C3E9E|nr:DUF6234 family protein [Actinomadura montaniterrae]
MTASQATPGGGAVQRGPGRGTDIGVAILLIVLQMPVVGYSWLSAGMDGWARSFDDESQYGPEWDHAVLVTRIAAAAGVAVALMLLAFGRGRRGWLTAITQSILAIVLLGGAYAAHHEAHPPTAPVQQQHTGEGVTSCTAQAHAKAGCN